jgi:hypothetical protein
MRASQSPCNKVTYCALCIARCGAIATVAGDRLVALAPDPSHPTNLDLAIAQHHDFPNSFADECARDEGDVADRSTPRVHFVFTHNSEDLEPVNHHA